jgi:hypothetical protein
MIEEKSWNFNARLRRRLGEGAIADGMDAGLAGGGGRARIPITEVSKEAEVM